MNQITCYHFSINSFSEVIYVTCIDPENGRYLALFRSYPQITGEGSNEGMALIDLLEQHKILAESKMPAVEPLGNLGSRYPT